jgi:hypothetical protein
MTFLCWSSSFLPFALFVPRFPPCLSYRPTRAHLYFSATLGKVSYNSRLLSQSLHGATSKAVMMNVLTTTSCYPQSDVCVCCVVRTSTWHQLHYMEINDHLVHTSRLKDVACAYEHISREPLNYGTDVWRPVNNRFQEVLLTEEPFIGCVYRKDSSLEPDSFRPLFQRIESITKDAFWW